MRENSIIIIYTRWAGGLCYDHPTWRGLKPNGSIDHRNWHQVAIGSTKKECISDARIKGYSISTKCGG